MEMRKDVRVKRLIAQIRNLGYCPACGKPEDAMNPYCMVHEGEEVEDDDNDK
jgi:hypothetical protein